MGLGRRVGSIILGLALVAAAGGARAATFTVNSTADSVDASPGDGACLTAGSVCTLRAAIQEANATPAADTIVLPAGTYTVALANPSAVDEDLAATGDLDITQPLIIQGAGVAATIVDGGGLDRVFEVTSTAGAVTIQALTIQNGFVAGPGGGINHASPSALFLFGVVVRNCTADAGSFGGGIFSNGALTMNDSTISGCNATSNGGGLHAVLATAAIVINRSTISGNACLGGGGGIYANTSAQVALNNSTISGNSATTQGGGVQTLGTGTAVRLSSVTVTNNTCDSDNNGSGNGGGVSNGASIIIKNTIIAGNFDLSGGGVDCSGDVASLGYNFAGTSCTLTGTATGNIRSNDHGLGPLADNGGPTLTHALLSTSQSVDAGNPAGCTDNLNAALTTDQRKYAPRAIDGNGDSSAVCDIGAYEYLATAAVHLLGFTATRAPEGVRLAWQTGAELGCGAFTLRRCALATGDCASVDDHAELAGVVVPCAGDPAGSAYEALDAEAAPTGAYSYFLVEHATDGATHHYGPARVGPAASPATPAADPAAAARGASVALAADDPAVGPAGCAAAGGTAGLAPLLLVAALLFVRRRRA